MKLSSENQRVWDIVREARYILCAKGYITDAEYAALASDHPAFERLADYYVLKAELAAAVKRLEDYDAAKAQVAGVFLAASHAFTDEYCKHDSPIIGASRGVQAIAKLTPADAERSLQVYAQERVVEEAGSLLNPNDVVSEAKFQSVLWAAISSVLSPNGQMLADSLQQKLTIGIRDFFRWHKESRLVAATARLAELKK